MENIAKKEEFLKFRIDPITQDLMERARPYVNLDKSRFARQSIREKAETIIAEHEKTVFSEHDWHIFFNAIENPPEPTQRLKNAAVQYGEIIGH
jgi:uncharacterized protein (DUF1778 family)